MTALPPDKLGPTPRTKVRRVPQRASYDRDTIHAILDEAQVAHVGFVDDGLPVVIPTSHWRVGDQLYVHSAATSRMIKAIVSGAPVCVTVTLIDGLVMAKSAYNHTVNYRSVVLFGQGRLVTDRTEALMAFNALIDKLEPGRSAHVRPPNEVEWNATALAALPISEASAKIRKGPPGDTPADLSLPIWTGVIPLALTAGPPEKV